MAKVDEVRAPRRMVVIKKVAAAYDLRHPHGSG